MRKSYAANHERFALVGIGQEIFKHMPDLHELNARCDSDPVRLELWVESEWRRWRYALRAAGKRHCVAAALEAIGSLQGQSSYPNYPGTGNLQYGVHDRLKARLYTSLVVWLAADSRESRQQIAEALTEFNQAVADERAKGWYIVCSEVQPADILALLCQAVLANRSFEVPIRRALLKSGSATPGIVQRFRQLLIRRCT